MKLIVEKMFENSLMPVKEHARSSGFDVFVHRFIKLYHSPVGDTPTTETVYDIDPKQSRLIMLPADRVMIGTGIRVGLDYRNTDLQNFCIHHGMTWEIQVRSRSGTSLKRGLVVTNSPGTIDDGYTGELCVIVTNTTGSQQNIEVGERIAQIVPAMVALPDLIQGVVLATDTRGDGGFNSTGTK